MVRIRGRDSAEKRAAGRAVSIKHNGYTTLSASATLLPSKDGCGMLLTSAAILAPFIEGDSAATLLSALEMDALLPTVSPATLLQDDAEHQPWVQARLLGMLKLDSIKGLLQQVMRWSGWQHGFTEASAEVARHWRFADSLAVFEVRNSAELGDVPAIRPAADLQPGEEFLCIASPYGIFAPYAFFNTYVRGLVAAVVPTQASSSDTTRESALLLLDATLLPGTEGAPLYDQRGALMALVLPPLRKRGVAGEMAIAVPMEAVLRQLTAFRQPSAHLVPGPVAGTPQFPLLESLPAPVGDALHSLACVQIGDHWASGVILGREYVITSAHLLQPFLLEPKLRGPVRVQPGVVVLLPATPVRRRNRPHELSGDGWLSLEATVEYKSNATDIALLRLRLPLAEEEFRRPRPASQPVTEGERIYVLGYPSFPPSTALPPAFTSGLITRLLHGENGLTCILTSAVIVAGNSGGMLLNRSGELLGIVTNNLREKSGHLIPTLNFTLPLRRLQPILRYVSGAATAGVLEELEELSEREGRIWRLEVVARPPPPAVARVLGALEERRRTTASL
jgi:S1-C subfamily serine protease